MDGQCFRPFWALSKSNSCLKTKIKDQDANRIAPLYPMPVPQYLQNSYTPLYSLNVECPLQALHADIGRQLAVLFQEMVGNFEHGA